MSNPLLALLNQAASQLPPSASANASANASDIALPSSPSSPPSAPSSLASPFSTHNAVPSGSRSPLGLPQLHPPKHASSSASYALPNSLLGLLSIAPTTTAPPTTAESPLPSTHPRKQEPGLSKRSQVEADSSAAGNGLEGNTGQEAEVPPLPNPVARLLGHLTGSAMSDLPPGEGVQAGNLPPGEEVQAGNLPPGEEVQAGMLHGLATEKSRESVASSPSTYALAAAAPSKFDFQSPSDQLGARSASAEQLPQTSTDAPRSSNGRPTAGSQAAKTIETEPSTLPQSPPNGNAPDKSTVENAPSSVAKSKKEHRAASAGPRSDLELVQDLLASHHLAALHATSSYAEASTSGMSTEKASDNTTIFNIDIAAPQPAGIRSLHPAKLEISPITLVLSPFVHHAVDVYPENPESLAAYGHHPLAQLHQSRITSLGHDVVAYVMNKGKIRLLHLRTGERTILQVPHKRALSSIRAFAVADDRDWRVVATHASAEDGSSEAIFTWKVTLDGTFKTEALTLWSSELSGGRLLTCQQGSEYSYKAHLFAVLTPRQGQETKMVSQLFPAVETLARWTASAPPPKMLTVAHEGQVLVAALASHRPDYVIIEAGSRIQLIVKASAHNIRNFTLPLLPWQEEDSSAHLPSISLLLPVYEQDGDGEDGLRGVLVGFTGNSILALFDLEGGWRYIWRFNNLPRGHFTLAHLYEESSTLFLANSARSSIFTLSLNIKSSSTSKWFLPSAHSLTEFALPEPCTSFSVIRQGDSETGAVRVFAVHPRGVHAFDVPLPIADENFVFEESGFDAGNVAATEIATTEGHSESVVDVSESTPGHGTAKRSGETGDATAPENPSPSALSPPPADAHSVSGKDEGPVGPEKTISTSQVSSTSPQAQQPGSISMAEQSRSSSVRRGTRGGTKTKRVALNENGSHPRTVSSATANQASNGAAIDGKEDDRSSTAKETPDFSTIQASLQQLESRLKNQLEKIITVNAVDPLAIPSPDFHIPPSALTTVAEEVAKTLASQINSAVVPQILASVRSATQAEMRNGFNEALQQHLPAELSRLIERPDVLSSLSRAISSGIIPVAQKTAVEVVSQVLAPHFEQTMLGVAQRVEAKIGSEMTDVRKSVIAEQSTALESAEEQLADMNRALALMSKQIIELSSQSKALSNAVEEMKASSLRASVRDVDPQASSAQSLAQTFPPGHTQSTWIPLEPFQPSFAHPGPFGAAGHRPMSHNLYVGQAHQTHQPSFSPVPSTRLPNQTSGPPQHLPLAPPTIAGDEVVEDVLLSALSSSDPDNAILPVLQRLKAQYGRPEAALLQHDAASGSEKLAVSQPVLLALLNTISNIAKGRATREGSSGPEVLVPWAEACAMRLNVADESIKVAYTRICERIKRGFEEGWTEEHLNGPARWWTRERFEAYLLRYLPSGGHGR